MNTSGAGIKFTMGFGDTTGKMWDSNHIRYPQQAASILNACPDIEFREKQELTIIWFDIEIVIDTDNTQWIKKRLHTLNPYVLFYSDIDRLSLYLETAKKETIILIMLQGSHALLPAKWNDNAQIKSFRISTFDEFEQVFANISHYLSETLENKHTSGRLMLDSSLNISQRDVRNESFRILCYRMYKKILLDTNLISDNEAKLDFITLCRNHYRMDYADDILQFENSYSSDDAVRWYTKNSFVYRLVNRALRTQDLESLFILRFYLHDLTECLRNDWNIWRNNVDRDSIIRLFRGQVVQNRIRLELEKSQGKIVSINGYWSTSRNEEVARMFGSIGSRPAETDGESILFEININLNASDCILADISKYSALPVEEEVLFDLDATFTIENVTEKKENNVPYWLVRMNAVKDSGMACILKSIEQRCLYDSTGFDVMWSAQPSVNPFECLLQLNYQLHYLHRFEMMTLDWSKSVEVKEDDAPLLHYITAVKLILSVGSRPELNIDEQKILCQGIMHLTLSVHLLTLDKRYELVRWPQRAIGLIHYKSCDYVRALKQWTRIIDDNGKSDPFHTAICCFYLGLTYNKLKQYKQAIEAFERALVHTDTMPAIFEAQCQMQIGHSIELQGIETYGCYPPARVHYEKALDFYESRIEPPDEVALALCYAIIGNCHFFENAFSEDANRYYLKSINVYDAIFLLQAPPPVLTQARLLIVGVLFHIALTYYQQFSMTAKAQECFQRIVTYSIEYCPFDSFALSHRYLGEINYSHYEQYEQAVEHFQVSATFYESHSPDDYWELALCNKWLAMVHFKLRLYQLSIDYGLKAIDLLQKPRSSQPTNKFVGNEFAFLKRVTCVQQKNQITYNEHNNEQALSETYRLIGDAYEQIHELDLSLAAYECALEINQDFSPIYQLETVITESRLGILFNNVKEMEEASTYQKKALNRLKHLYTTVEG